MKSRTVACPQCGAHSEWSTANRFRPFCSERCKMIDLGAWAAERYRVPVAPTGEDETERLPEDRDSPDFSPN